MPPRFMFHSAKEKLNNVGDELRYIYLSTAGTATSFFRHEGIVNGV